MFCFNLRSSVFSPTRVEKCLLSLVARDPSYTRTLLNSMASSVVSSCLKVEIESFWVLMLVNLYQLNFGVITAVQLPYFRSTSIFWAQKNPRCYEKIKSRKSTLKEYKISINSLRGLKYNFISHSTSAAIVSILPLRNASTQFAKVLR